MKDIRQKCIKEGSNGIVFVVKIENISFKCIKGKSLMHSNLIFDTNGKGKYCNAVYQYISSFYSVLTKLMNDKSRIIIVENEYF